MTTDADPRQLRQRRADDRISALAHRYLDALRAGSSTNAEHVMDDALVAGVPSAGVHALIIDPAMVRIGELWAGNAISVGLRMVADVLDGAGFDVLFLGADVPLSDLRTILAERQPSVTGLGFNIASDVGHLAEAILAVHEVIAEPRIMVGGRAVPPVLRDACYPIVRSSLDVVPTVERLLDAPPQTVSPAVQALISQLARGGPSGRTIGATDAVAERLAEVVVESSELAREYIRQTRMFRDLALRDPVTGLANRRAFDDRFYLQTRGNHGDGVLLMIDMDEFKQGNDTTATTPATSFFVLSGRRSSRRSAPRTSPLVSEATSLRRSSRRRQSRHTTRGRLALYDAKAGGRNQVAPSRAVVRPKPNLYVVPPAIG